MNVEKRRNSLYYYYGFYLPAGKKHISCCENLPHTYGKIRGNCFL